MKQEMKIDWRVVVVFLVTGVFVVAIAGWGDRVGIPAGAITWAQGIVSMIGAGVIAMLPKLITYAETEIERRTTTTVVQQTTTDKRQDGGAAIEVMGGIVGAAAFAAAAALLLHGCTTSAIHDHAIAAHSAFVVETAGGTTITSAEASALAACPHDDGAERTHCIDTVAGVARAAGAVHDALGPAVLAYRAATLTACGVDPNANDPEIPDTCPPDSPDVTTMLDAAAAPIVAALPTLIAALRALSTLAGGH